MIPARWLRETVTVEPFKGSGAYGPVFGDPVQHRARVEYARQMVRNGKGDEVVAEVTVYLAAGTEVKPGSNLTLADGSTWTTLTYAPVTDGQGRAHHTKVTL